MEIVSYSMESDPSKAIAANNKLVESFKQITGATDSTAAAMDRYNKTGVLGYSVNQKMNQSLSQISTVTVNGRDRFMSFSNSVESAGISALKTTGAFGSMNSTLGGMPNLLLGVAGGLDNIADKSNALSSSVGVATSQIGGFGTAALVAGAAFVGWQIGTWISETTGLGNAVEDTASTLIDMAADAGTLGEVLGRLTGQYDAVAAAAGRMAQEDAQFQASGQLGAAVMARYGLSVDEFSQMLAAANGNVELVAASMFKLSQATEEAGKKFESAYSKQITASNQKVLDFYKSNTELRDRYMQEAAALEAQGLQNLTEIQRKELTEKQQNVEKYTLAVLAEQKSANEKLLADQKSASDRAISEAERRRAAMVKIAMAETKERVAASALASSGFGAVSTGTFMGTSVDINAITSSSQQAAAATAELTTNLTLANSMGAAFGLTADQVSEALGTEWTTAFNGATLGVNSLLESMDSTSTVTQTFKGDLVDLMIEMTKLYDSAPNAFDAMYQQLLLTNPQVALLMQQLMQMDAAKPLEAGATAAEKFQAKLQALGGMLSGIANAVGGLAGSILGSLVPAIESAMSTYKDVLAKTGSKTAAVAGGIGAAADVAGQAIGGKTGGALSTIGQYTAMGATFGPWGAAVGAAVGVAIAAFNLMKKDWAADSANIIENMYKLQGVSEEVMQKIAEDAEKLGDSVVATVKNQALLMKDTGITAQNLGTYLGMARDNFVLLTEGFISSAEAAENLDSVFGDLAAAADSMGGTYQKQIWEMIDLTRQFGVEVQAVTDYVNSNISKLVSGINVLAAQFQKFIDTIPEGNYNIGKLPDGTLPQEGAFDPMPEDQANKIKARYRELEQYIVQTFTAMRAAGYSYSEILEQLGPAMDTMRAAAERFGLTGTEGFQDIERVMEVLGKSKGRIERLDAITGQMQAMRALGIQPTMQQFQMFEKQINNTYKALQKNGLTGREALQQMIPALQEAIRLHELFGLPIDENTQRLIDQAEAAGLLEETDPTAVMREGFEKMNATMTLVSDNIARLVEALGGIPAVIPVDIDVTYNETNSPPWEGDGFSTGGGGGDGSAPKPNNGKNITDSWAGLKNPLLATGPYTSTIHGGEMILDEDSALAFREGVGRSVQLRYSPTIVAAPGMDERALADASVQAWIDAYRAGRFQQMLGEPD